MKIHADLQPSRLRRGVEVGLYLLVAILTVWSGLPLWVMIVTILLLLGVFALQSARAAAVPRLIQLIQIDRRIWCWYQIVASPQHGMQTTRVEAELQQVQRVGPVVVLRFQALGANVRPQSWVIWRDQVDDNNWRRLVVLARFWVQPVAQS